MERREFTVLSALALLGGATITVSGCGGGGNPMSGPTAGDGSVNGTISANHGHIATITAADLSSNGDLTLNIQGTASHNHVVALTAADVTGVRGGQTVAKQSTNTNDHDHTVTFKKGSGNPGGSGPGY